jgi:hypothetical protein
MRFTGAVALALLLSRLALSQTPDSNHSGVPPSVNAAPSSPQVQPPASQTPQQPSYANYSIMLVNPAGGAVVLMHNPKNELELVEVNNTKQAFSVGYVPVRAVELADLIAALRDENARLADENSRLRALQARQDSAVTSSVPSSTDAAAQQRAQTEAQKAARRQQLIQTWMMLQMSRPQTQPYQLPMPVNPNTNRLQTNCTTSTYGNTAYTNCN